MTNRAAILVLERGTRKSLKNFIGPAPSSRADSNNSSGIVMNTCLNMNVAVADAISGILRPA
jgi:hypothetical protein